MKRKNNFIDEQELIEQWQVWKDSAERVEDRKIPARLVEQMYIIAQHLLEHPRFVRYKQQDKDDMKQEAVIKMAKNLKNFNPSKGKLFSYLTYCSWTAFVVYLAQYYKDLNKRREQIMEVLNSIDEKQIGSTRFLKELLEDLKETMNEYGKNDEDDE